VSTAPPPRATAQRRASDHYGQPTSPALGSTCTQSLPLSVPEFASTHRCAGCGVRVATVKRTRQGYHLGSHRTAEPADAMRWSAPNPSHRTLARTLTHCPRTPKHVMEQLSTLPYCVTVRGRHPHRRGSRAFVLRHCMAVISGVGGGCECALKRGLCIRRPHPLPIHHLRLAASAAAASCSQSDGGEIYRIRVIDP
jgi:hypothetical protein